MLAGILAILLGALCAVIGRLGWRDPARYWTPLVQFWGGPSPLMAILLGGGMAIAGVGAVGITAGARAVFYPILVAGACVMGVGIVIVLVAVVWHPRWTTPPVLRGGGGDPAGRR